MSIRVIDKDIIWPPWDLVYPDYIFIAHPFGLLHDGMILQGDDERRLSDSIRDYLHLTLYG